MRLHKSITALCVFAVFGGSAALPIMPAEADTQVGAVCYASAYGTNFTGANSIYYYKYNSSAFLLDYDTYRFAPSASGSVHNNQNFRFYGGSNSTDQYSPDSLVRDNTIRRDQDMSDFGSISGTVGASSIYFYDIFDVPSKNDPECQTQTKYI